MLNKTVPAILKAAILQILMEQDGEPVPEKYIMLALRVQYHIKPTHGDLCEVIQDLDEKRLINGTQIDDGVLVWVLSTKGKLKAMSVN